MIAFISSVMVTLFLVYNVYKKLIIKINAPELKERSEINSLIIEFNKISKNNIDLLEEKVEEIRNLLLLVDKKTAELQNAELQNRRQVMVLPEIKTVAVTEINPDPPLSKKEKKKNKRETKPLKQVPVIPVRDSISFLKHAPRQNKGELIRSYLTEGRTEKEIAGLLGISVTEVELYSNLITKK